MYDTSIEKTKKSISPNKFERELLMKRPKLRNPSVKTTKSKVSNYRKKKSTINIYPKQISFDYSNNNEYTVLNYTNHTSKHNQSQASDNLIKEKNEVIQNLQSQINKYVAKLKESLKKINIQNRIINSLKSQNSQLNNENARKKNIIRQNEDIDLKINKLRKDAEKSREKILNDDFNESKRNNYILNNKINNLKKELKEKEEEINKLKSKNDYLIKFLKENESKLSQINSQNNILKQENILTKNQYNDLQIRYNNLFQQLNDFNTNEQKNIDTEINNNNYDIGEMKTKSYENELRTKNLNLNILTEQNQFLNSMISQKNAAIKNLQKEKINLNKNLSNITMKNMELNKILNKKHEDIIQFQVSLLDKDKKIKKLTEYINNQKYNQNINIKKLQIRKN